MMSGFTEEQYLRFERAIAQAMAQRRDAQQDSDSESLPDPELTEVEVNFRFVIKHLKIFYFRTCVPYAENHVHMFSCFVATTTMMNASCVGCQGTQVAHAAG